MLTNINNELGELVKHALLAVTEIFPLKRLAVPVMLLVEDEPVQPDGSVHE